MDFEMNKTENHGKAIFWMDITEKATFKTDFENLSNGFRNFEMNKTENHGNGYF